MATDYEAYYRENEHGLGEPFPEFVAFFKTYDKPSAQVLDLGCGQGRDALFIARLGYCVTGVDIAGTGIKQMLTDAEREDLPITGIVADITEFTPTAEYDVILLDRTLHMIPDVAQRVAVLQRMSAHLVFGGHLLIADERKNLPAFKTCLQQQLGLEITFYHSGYLFSKK